MRELVKWETVKASTAKVKLSDIADEIIQLLASDPNATVRVTLEVSAEYPSGAPDHIQRGVSVNAPLLSFKVASWEE